MKKAAIPRTKRFPAAKQRRMDELLDKNSEGTITPAEKTKLEQLVTEAEQLAVINAKQLAELSQGQSSPVGAIPLTVWVAPQVARQ